METVLDALKAMKKASAREIAARMKIEVRDALEMLSEQQELGTVKFLNGCWSLPGKTAAAKVTVGPESVQPDKTPDAVVKIDEQQLAEAIKKHGPQTADELAALFGITARRVASTLTYALSKGRLNRENRNGKLRYCLPVGNLPVSQESSPVRADDGKPAPQQEGVKLPDPEITEKMPADSVAEVVQSIPSFTEKRPDDLMIPAPRFISAEIRRTAAKLKRLQALREVAREVHKPRNRKLWQQIRGE
ncbi:TPA: DUF1627 domain-containing protein [Salmonella enterica subsp. salamae serovar 28:r:e,n,z15]|nr:DUF1627 domain-containing protein [Salmonella enterica subsp. salamae serovar 28:r:e,n,z15]